MEPKKKKKLKRFYLHPITVFLLLTILVIIISAISSLLEVQATYNIVNENTNELEPVLITVENLLTLENIKIIISDSLKNFLSFSPLGTLLMALIGISVAEGSGFIETLTKKYFTNIPNWALTFIVIFLATTSSLINEVGYAILIPLFALIYFIKGRNPLLAIVTAFCGVAFGYGVSIFVGSTDIALMSYTKSAAHLIDESYHVGLSANLVYIIVATIVTSIVGTIVIEKFISYKIGHYKKEEDFSKTEQYRVINFEEEEQRKIENEKNQKKGLKRSLIVGLIVTLIYIYMLIPGLPASGLLLDTNAKTYADQLFGDNSYFQSSFTTLVTLLLFIMGLSYGIGSKTIKNDKQLVEASTKKFSDIGSLILLMFVFSQFISVYKMTNLGTIITTWLANLLSKMTLSGISLIVIVTIFIAISNLFLTSNTTKWMIYSPIVVPMFMQANMTPEFAQAMMRSAASITNGMTPIMASFVIYIGYLNIYNLNKEKPYTINSSLKLIRPYFLTMIVTWLFLLIFFYLIGLPIGGSAFPTL